MGTDATLCYHKCWLLNSEQSGPSFFSLAQRTWCPWHLVIYMWTRQNKGLFSTLRLSQMSSSPEKPAVFINVDVRVTWQPFNLLLQVQNRWLSKMFMRWSSISYGICSVFNALLSRETNVTSPRCWSVVISWSETKVSTTSSYWWLIWRGINEWYSSPPQNVGTTERTGNMWLDLLHILAAYINTSRTLQACCWTQLHLSFESLPQIMSWLCAPTLSETRESSVFFLPLKWFIRWLSLYE